MTGTSAVRGGGLPQATDDEGRHESEQQREDRNLAELLQELRVASIGIQVLFAFLLSLPFTNRFRQLDQTQRHLYVATLLLAALAIALLSAPVAFHRMVFHQHKKAALLRIGNAMALAGLAAVGLAVSGAVLLVVGVVLHGWAVPVIAAATLGVFVVLWLVVPLAARELASPDERRSPGAPDHLPDRTAPGPRDAGLVKRER